MYFDEPTGIGLLIILIMAFFALLFLAMHIFFHWRIFSRTGLPGVLSLLLLLPVVDLIILGYFAFTDWPILKELRELKEKQTAGN
jgi:hypothetical protein